MVFSSLEELSDAQKQEFVAALSAVVVGSAGADVTADSLSAVATASGNSLSAAWASVFASAVSKVRSFAMIYILICLLRGLLNDVNLCVGQNNCCAHMITTSLSW